MKRSILMLEHDDDDRYITQAVFDENRYPLTLQFVDNSNDLFAHLLSCERRLMPFPALILLNHFASPLNAVDIVKSLKGNPNYMHIPVVVISGIRSADIVHRCYEAGANSFILKPPSSVETERTISSFVRYWFETVELPS